MEHEISNPASGPRVTIGVSRSDHRLLQAIARAAGGTLAGTIRRLARAEMRRLREAGHD